MSSDPRVNMGPIGSSVIEIDASLGFFKPKISDITSHETPDVWLSEGGHTSVISRATTTGVNGCLVVEI